jgi:Domain of unknown function (DUF4383)
MVSHLPKNHRLRGFYRLVAGVAGSYCLVFGIVGIVRTHASGPFDMGPYWALGLKTNLAFSILSVVVGVVAIGAIVIGRNVDRNLNIVLGPGFIAVGLLMMALMQTNANVLNYSMSTCIVSFVIGLAFLISGFYGEVADQDAAAAEERFRRNAPDPERLRHP